MEFIALGPVEVRVDRTTVGLTPPKTAVIAQLLMADGRSLSADNIIEGMYQARILSLAGKKTEPRRPTAGSFRVAVTEMRKTIVGAAGFDPIETVAGGYRLDLDGSSFDVVEFRALLAEARKFSALAPLRSFEAYEGALTLVGGEPFEGYPAIEATEDYLEQVHRDVADAARERIEPAVAIGRGGDFIRELQDAVVESPGDEHLRMLLMRALSTVGRYSEAEQEFSNFEKLLDIDYHGAITSPEINRLHIDVLTRAVSRPQPQLPLPASIETRSTNNRLDRTTSPNRLVGRDELLSTLNTGQGPEQGASLTYTILRGEAGVGKSRLAYEAARRAHDEGAIVLHARVEHELQPPLGPIAELVRYVARGTSDMSPREVFGSGVGDLARLVPELAREDPDIVVPRDLDTDTERFRLLEAFVEWLSRMSSIRRVVIVIDDIHDASAALLKTLRYLARSPARLDVAIIATARPKTGRGASASDFERHLHAMSRNVIDVSGLDLSSCIEYISSARGELDERARVVAGMIHQAAQGNPFFIDSIVRTIERRGLAETVDGSWHVSDDLVDVEIPQDVMETVAERFDGLSDNELEIVRTAALIGVVFDSPLLITASGHSASVVGSLRSRLAHDGIIQAVPGSGDRWRFAHDLLRESLVVPLSREERSPFHLRIATALDDLRGSRPDAPRDAISFHYYRSLWSGGTIEGLESVSDMSGFENRARRAIELCELGAVEAMSDRQYSQAAVLLHRHLKILHQWDNWATTSVVGAQEEISLLIRWGRALREAAEPATFGVLLHACLLAEGAQDRDSIEEAITLLQTQGWLDDQILTLPELSPRSAETHVRYPSLLGEAARANTRGAFSVAGGPRSLLRSAWLERALQNESDLGDKLSAILNARLSMEKIYVEPPDTGLVRAEKAWAIAQAGELSVDNQLRIMSDLLQLLWRPDQMDRRRQVVKQMDQLARRVNKPHWLWAANSFGFQLASESGDLAEADTRLTEMIQLADLLKQPRLVQWTRLRQAVREAIRGDFDRSEELAVAGWRAATVGSDTDADLFLLGQLYTIQFHRDALQSAPVVNVGGPRARGATLAQLFAAKFADFPFLPVLSAALAATYALEADRQMTQHWIDEWNAKGARFVTVNRRDQDQLAAIAALSVGATYVRDDETCEILYETLSPYPELFIDNATSVHGSAAYYLATLLSAMGKYGESDEMFAYALEQNRSIESPTFEGLSLIGWAESLADRRPDLAYDNLLAATRVVADHPSLVLVSHRIERLEPRVMSA